jgi:hypothetical protein
MFFIFCLLKKNLKKKIKQKEHMFFILSTKNTVYLWGEHMLIKKTKKTGFTVHSTQHPSGEDQEKKNQGNQNQENKSQGTQDQEKNNQGKKNHRDSRSLPWCSDPLYAGM